MPPSKSTKRLEKKGGVCVSYCPITPYGKNDGSLCVHVASTRQKLGLLLTVAEEGGKESDEDDDASYAADKLAEAFGVDALF